MPLPKIAQLELTKLKEALGNSSRGDFERTLRARLRARGAECFAMLTPGTSRHDVIEQVAASECMKGADDAFLTWLKLRRIAVLLQRAPLGSSASVPRLPVISTSEYIRSVHVARNAAVVLVAGPGQYTMLDVRTGATLSHWDWHSPSGGELSPNGRVAAIGDGNRVALVDVESGDVIHYVRDTEPSAFVWLNERLAAFWMPASRRAMLLDFEAGVVKPARDLPEGWPLRIVAMPGASSEFLAFTGAKVSRLKVAINAVEARIVQLEEKPFDVRNFMRNAGTLTSDGSVYVGSPRGLSLTSTKTLRTREVLLEPLDVRWVFALRDPDQVLLRTASTKPEEYVYSISKATLAKVIDPHFSGGYFYVPAVRALLTYSGKDIAPAEDLETAAPESLDAFRERMSHQPLSPVPLSMPAPAPAQSNQPLTRSVSGAQTLARPDAPKLESRAGHDPANVVASIKPCQTTSAELASMLGIPSNPLNAGRQFVLGPLKSELQERRWLLVFVDKDGVVKDVFWDDLSTSRFTPGNSCPQQGGPGSGKPR